MATSMEFASESGHEDSTFSKFDLSKKKTTEYGCAREQKIAMTLLFLLRRRIWIYQIKKRLLYLMIRELKLKSLIKVLAEKHGETGQKVVCFRKFDDLKIVHSGSIESKKLQSLLKNI